MKRWILIETLIYVGLFWIASSSQAQTLSDSSRSSAQAETEVIKGTLTELATEIKALRYELKTLQLEQLRMRVVSLEQELAQAVTKRQHLETQEHTRSQEIAQLEQHLNESALVPEERRELEASRSELIGGELQRVRQEKQAVAQREAQITELLAREQESWQELCEIAKATWNELQRFTANTRSKDSGQ